MTAPRPDPVPFEQHLLPPNAPPLMRVLAGAAAGIQDIPVPTHLVRRPYEVPAAFLPHLAWEVSLDVWFDDWPEWRKRRATAKSIELHRLKGTLAGIKGWLDLLGAELVEAVIPPEGCFATRGRTIAEKQAFAGNFAQLRLYPFRKAETAPPKMLFATRHQGGGKFWAVADRVLPGDPV